MRAARYAHGWVTAREKTQVRHDVAVVASEQAVIEGSEQNPTQFLEPDGRAREMDVALKHEARRLYSKGLAISDESEGRDEITK